MTEVDKQSSPEIYISNNKFGSAGNRTQEQMKKGLEDAKKRIGEVPAGQPIIFTDGSALGNPGPCGASAIGSVHSKMTLLEKNIFVTHRIRFNYPNLEPSRFTNPFEFSKNSKIWRNGSLSKFMNICKLSY